MNNNMNNAEMELLIRLERGNDDIASNEKKWHWTDKIGPSDYNFWYFEFAIHKFMDTIADFQYERISDYVLNFQDVCEAVNDLLPHWHARIQATASESFSEVMNRVIFRLSVQKICDSTNSDNIEGTENVYVDLMLVDAELERVTKPTSVMVPYPYLHVEKIGIHIFGEPISVANDVCWSPFIREQDLHGRPNHIVLAVPCLPGSPTVPNNQDRHDDHLMIAYITMGIGEICDFLSRLQFLFEQNGYKILTRAESRRHISDYCSNSSAMKGFLEARRSEDEEKTCSRFELIIKDGQLRKERAPKTESDH